MKQESVNTFNEGLVYDLNPITTPNNVLTDCINGTFLTFNGDELSLQNDAGNTTIGIVATGSTLYDPLKNDYEIGNNVHIIEDGVYTYYRNLTGNNDGTLNATDWKELIVRLSDGFYPIGIKEYGGILYIVSAKVPDIVPTLFSGTGTYNLGDVVYQVILEENYYYESLKSSNQDPLELTSTAGWLYVGKEKDFINKYGFIEFGSYPSPEIVNADELDTSENYSIVNVIDTDPQEFKNQLYNPKVINNSNFRAGTYVIFNPNSGSLVTDNISFQAFNIDQSSGLAVYSELNSTRKIYKVKLLHQLSNGFIDLTDDVWQQYANFVAINRDEELNSGIGTDFWFNDPEFKYYCPHNFKGKLVITTELEDMDLFNLQSNPHIELNVDEDYLITFTFNYENFTLWNQLGISSPTATIYYTTDGTDPDYTKFPEIPTLKYTREWPLDDFYLILLGPSIGTAVFSGTGLNDLIISGSYSRDILQTLRIKITKSSTVDWFNWSLDGGTTWEEEEDPTNLIFGLEMQAGPMELGETGISVEFNAITGHDEDDYWESILDPGKNNTTLKYKIVLEFYYDSQIIPYEYFPQEFLDKHTISGSIVVTQSIADLTIKKDENTQTCEEELGEKTGYKITNRIILVNSNGENVDNNGDPVSGNVVYFFYRTGTTAPVDPDEHGIAEYTIGEDDDNLNKAVVDTTSYDPSNSLGDLQDIIQSKVESTLVREYDETCIYVDLLVEINQDYGVMFPIPVKVLQDGEWIYGVPYNNQNIIFLFKVKPDVEFTIRPYNSKFVDAYYYSDTISTSTVIPIKFGLVTDIKILKKSLGTGYSYTDHYYVGITGVFGLEPINPENFNTVLVNENFFGEYLPVVSVPIISGLSSTMFGYDIIDQFPEARPIFTITFNNTSTVVEYVNLIGIEVFEWEDQLFLPSYTVSDGIIP